MDLGRTQHISISPEGSDNTDPAHGLPPPCKSLSERIDLIVVTTRKRKQLRHEIFTPRRLGRKKDGTSSKKIALSDQAGSLVGFRAR